MRSDKLKSSVENNTTIVTLPLGSNAERCAGSSPVTRTILVILNSCTPLKARSYGLYLHFRDEKFKVKTMAVFSPFSLTERIRTDAEEYLGKFQGRFERDDLKSAFFNI